MRSIGSAHSAISLATSAGRDAGLGARNGPGLRGGITPRQLRALTDALLIVPGFLEKHAEAIVGQAEAHFPLRYTDHATGASAEMADAD